MLKRLERCPSTIRAARANLRILATTDLHMHILPYDYLSDRPVDGWGLTNTARLIEEARAEEPNTILLDNGDFLHGTAMGDLVVEQYRAADGTDPSSIHPMIAAMDHLGYDAGTLGNHDFDRGVDVLFDAIQQAGFPIVSTNTITKRALHPTRDTPLVSPFTILNRYVRDDAGRKLPIRVGIVGFLPPGSLKFGQNDKNTPETRDIIETAQAFVPHVKARGADIVIALAHSGVGDDAHAEGMENALLPLSRVEGIDVIVGGHSHQTFPCHEMSTSDRNGISPNLNGVPTVVPGFWGSHLGVVDLALEYDGMGWRVNAPKAELRCVQTTVNRSIAGCEVAPDSEQSLPNRFAQLHTKTLARMRTPIAHTSQGLDNFLALVGVDSATCCVQLAMADYAHRYQNDRLERKLPVIAASAPFKSGGLAGPNYYTDVSPGQITLRSMADLYVFPNELALVRVTGVYMRNWLERAASIFNQVLPGDRAVPLKDDSTPGYLLDSVFGLTYRIDLSQPARFTPAGMVSGLGGGRIIDLRHKGKPVGDDDMFLLATSDFRVQGGGGYPVAPVEGIVDIPSIPIRDVLKAHFQKMGEVEVQEAPIWRFASVSGASVCFKSSPAALRVRKNSPWLPIKCINPCDEEGFAHYEMEL